MIENKVCPNCLVSNLTEEMRIARCAKCKEIYCLHLSSRIDPAYCIECLSEVSVVKELITKTYDTTDEDGNVVASYKRKAKRIKIDGLDWLFAQRKIRSLTDDELELAIEYHRDIMIGMADEREARRIAKAHRYASVKVQSLAAPINADGGRMITTTKITKEIKSTKKVAGAQAALAALIASGMTPQQMLAMLQGTTKTQPKVN